MIPAANPSYQEDSMAETTSVWLGPNPKIGSIEYVEDNGFIVESADPQDPAFVGGKRLFNNFDDLLRFMAEYMKVYKSMGNSFGIKREPDEADSGNGEKVCGKSQGGL
jgi:hypothetical protein